LADLGGSILNTLVDVLLCEEGVASIDWKELGVCTFLVHFKSQFN
jgi:hypothetical protein